MLFPFSLLHKESLYLHTICMMQGGAEAGALNGAKFYLKSNLLSVQGPSTPSQPMRVTEAWSCEHFQPKMGLLGTAGRQNTPQKNLAKVCNF
jgi:hypothetical protein